MGATCIAQEFIGNPDYIYGVGYSKKESVADTAALVSLARAISVRVENESVREVEETGRRFSERRFKRTNLSTSIKVDGAKKYVEKRGKEYVVYYYINKQEYIDDHILTLGTGIANADYYESSDDPHAINYILGELYTAYTAVDDALLNALYEKSISYKEYLLSEIRRQYENSCIRLSARKTKSYNWYEVTEENRKPLPGFEYRDMDGRWVSPSIFYDSDRVRCEGNPSEYKWALVRMDAGGDNGNYRLTFEREVDGRNVRVFVPDEFYRELKPLWIFVPSKW